MAYVDKDGKCIPDYTLNEKEKRERSPVERGVMCECQDSNGDICGKIMTKQEIKQDGMCCFCAENVFVEMTQNNNHKWYHGKNT